MVRGGLRVPRKMGVQLKKFLGAAKVLNKNAQFLVIFKDIRYLDTKSSSQDGCLVNFILVGAKAPVLWALPPPLLIHFNNKFPILLVNFQTSKN